MLLPNVPVWLVGHGRSDEGRRGVRVRVFLFGNTLVGNADNERVTPDRE